MRYVWLVEALVDGNWRSTNGCYWSRQEAREDIQTTWVGMAPQGRFRVRKYVAQEGNRG